MWWYEKNLKDSWKMSLLHSRRAPKLEPKSKQNPPIPRSSAERLTVKGPGPGSLRRSLINTTSDESPALVHAGLAPKSSIKTRCTLKRKVAFGCVLAAALLLYYLKITVMNDGRTEQSVLRSFLRSNKSNIWYKSNHIIIWTNLIWHFIPAKCS